MLNEIKQILENLKNPASGETLSSENRWQHIGLDNGVLHVQYNRDGISPSQKRLIEQQIHQALKEFLDVDQIFIKTTSSSSQDIFGALESKQNPKENEQPLNTKPAQLKAGHGTIGGKKSVPGVGKIIAVGSGKGGVGKSTFTSNLAVTLSKMGYKVAVIDADIYGPSLPMIFGKREEKPRSNSERKILPVEAHGIKLISFGFFIDEKDPVIWRGPMLGGVLNQFLFDVDWQGVDYLIIDLPPGTGDIQLSMIQNTHVDGAIIISTPQDVALLDAKKGLEMFKKLNLPIIGMVENMSSFVCSDCGKEHFIFGESGVDRATKELKEQMLGKVPLELELRSSSDNGSPYMVQDEYSGRPVWNAFFDIAKKVPLFFKEEVDKPKASFFSRIPGFSK